MVLEVTSLRPRTVHEGKMETSLPLVSCQEFKTQYSPVPPAVKETSVFIHSDDSGDAVKAGMPGTPCTEGYDCPPPRKG